MNNKCFIGLTTAMAMLMFNISAHAQGKLNVIATTEDLVRPGIVHVPGELLGNDVDDHCAGIAFRGKRAHALRPARNGVSEQQDHLGHHDQELDALGRLPLCSLIAGHRVGTLAEPDQHEDEECAPSHEQDEHQPVHQPDHVVDRRGVRRCLSRQSQKIQH